MKANRNDGDPNPVTIWQLHIEFRVLHRYSVSSGFRNSTRTRGGSRKFHPYTDTARRMSESFFNKNVMKKKTPYVSTNFAGFFFTFLAQRNCPFPHRKYDVIGLPRLAAYKRKSKHPNENRMIFHIDYIA